MKEKREEEKEAGGYKVNNKMEGGKLRDKEHD
jgi:hypothetical protein